MKMYKIVLTLACVGQCHWGNSATFRNLGFEEVSSSIDPNSIAFGVPAASAVPYWRIFIGSNEVDYTSFNFVRLSLAAYTSVYSNQQFPDAVFEGQFSFAIYSGNDYVHSTWVDTAIAQTGLVPLESKSITLKTFYTGELRLLLDGQSLSLTILDRSNNGLLTVLTLGADISAFAGREHELRFVAHGFEDTGQGRLALLDDITFSSQPIPEPAGLLGIAALGGILWIRRRRRGGMGRPKT